MPPTTDDHDFPDLTRPADPPPPADAPWTRLDLGGPPDLRSPTAARRPGPPRWAFWAAVPVGLGALAVVYRLAARPAPPPPPKPVTLQILDRVEVKELQPLVLRVGVRAEGVAFADLTFRVVDPPPGVSIGAKTGHLAWTPDERQGPGTYTIVVQVGVDGRPEATDTATTVVDVREVESPPRLAAIPEQRTDGRDPVRVVARAEDDDLPPAALSYSLEPGAPAGATIDPATGRFEWDPRGQANGTYPVVVRVTEQTPRARSVQRSFRIRVERPEAPVETLIAGLRDRGLAVDAPLFPGTGPGSEIPLKVARDKVLIRVFDAPEAAEAAASAASAAVGTPADSVALYRVDATLIRHDGSDKQVAEALDALLGAPAFRRQVAPADVAKLIELVKDKGRLFDLKEYKGLRKLFADRFEQQYADEIRRAYGDEHAAMTAWLARRPDLREEFYTAIDTQWDDVVAALRLFKTLKDQFPKVFEAYGNLAIATAVTWDREEDVYDYGGHQRRTHARLPPGLVDAVGSFRALVQAEGAMEGRLQYLPWEFLAHVVNHKTPVDERRWALANYLPRRTQIGKCYGDVPYDGEMLATRGKITRLADQLYTLPNLKTYGGVCSMQADFAARVGKCNGVPAAEVVGDSSFGDLHAWVMWVELKDVSARGIDFTLESAGRYSGDKYYVGELRDPQTGRTITDRQLELRLHTVGVWPLARRHAALIMDSYPLIRDQAHLDVASQLNFLFQVMRLCPGDEAPWVELAKLARDGKITAQHRKQTAGALDQLFDTFRAFPDFTWTVFEDLIRPQATPAQQVGLFGRLIDIYEGADRPDLACEARLKQADLLLAQDRPGDAVAGLSETIIRFPDEGRYVPRLLDRLEEVCRTKNVPAQLVVQFYTTFLPKIPQKRGNTASKYCQDTYERAIRLFERNNQAALARELTRELALLRASSDR